jgi:hypothetical protein
MKSHDKSHKLAAILLTVPLVFFGLAWLCESILQHGAFYFDDSFISYRYARNLAEGHGLVWNVGEGPEEGYTNLLLILLLAPFLHFGADPLVVTRYMGFFSIAALSFVLYKAGRKAGATGAGALSASLTPFLIPYTNDIAMLGLETTIYGCWLAVLARYGCQDFEFKNRARAITFSLGAFLAVLLRPEAVLLGGVYFGVALVSAWKNNKSRRPVIFLAMGVYSSAGLAYLAWKWWYFGHIFPNPFYIKAAGTTLVCSSGMASVFDFVVNYPFVIVSAHLALLCRRSNHEDDGNRTARAFLLTYAAVYVLFFMRVETYMDNYGRFMHPLALVMLAQSAPGLARMMDRGLRLARRSPALALVCGLYFVLILNPYKLTRVVETVKVLYTGTPSRPADNLMQIENRDGKALALFPDVTKVRIAFGDAGLIAYHSRALWLDTVGLNNRTIALAKNEHTVTESLFSIAPDLLIIPSTGSEEWFTGGHRSAVRGGGARSGPPAEASRPHIFSDPRFDQYEYVGTSLVGGYPYDLNYFIHTHSTFHGSLAAFLRKSVVDGYHDPFPLPFGSNNPAERPATQWRATRSLSTPDARSPMHPEPNDTLQVQPPPAQGPTS